MVQISTPCVNPNRGMGPPRGAFCQITLTSCLATEAHISQSFCVDICGQNKVVQQFSRIFYTMHTDSAAREPKKN